MTADLQHAAGAVHDHALGLGVHNVLDLPGNDLCGDFRELHGIGTAKAAAHFFLVAGHVVRSAADELAGLAGSLHGAALVAGAVEGHLLVGVGEILGLQIKHVTAEGAEVRNLVHEAIEHACADVAVVGKIGGVLELQGRTAACAQGDDVVVVAVHKGADVLTGHILHALALAHHAEGQAAAGLIHGEVHCHVAGGKDLHCGNELLGIDEVLGAAGEDGHAGNGVAHLGGDVGPQVAEGLFGNGRQCPEVMSLHEHHGQMALELCTTGDRLLGLAGKTQQGVEELAVGHDHLHEGAHHVAVAVVHEAVAHFADEFGQVDAAGADVVTGFAAHAVLAQVLCLVLAVVEVGEDEADGAHVDVAHLVAADEGEDGAHVGAGAAAHAAEHFLEDRILHILGTAVVKEDDVHALLALGGAEPFGGTGNPGHVGGDALGRGVAGQDLQSDHGLVDGGGQLVQANQHGVHAGHGLNHAGIALVGDCGDGAALCNGKVAAGNTHVTGNELAAQLHAGHLHKAVDVGLLLHLGHLGEILGDLVAA